MTQTVYIIYIYYTGLRYTWGCYIMSSTQVRCGCEDTYCTIYELLLGQYWFTELHTTSYYTKWSAVIVLLHLTYQFFLCTESIFVKLFYILLSHVETGNNLPLFLIKETFVMKTSKIKLRLNTCVSYFSLYAILVT
jgi:hypothetical protein